MAALNKRWGGGVTTTGVYTLATNWSPISLRNSTYRWLASGSGTNEYYLDLAGGGDPGISTPGAVYANSAALSAGTVGSLTAGQYGYDDNDTLGYDTIYVRLTDGADPDSKALDYVQLYQAPVATDHVRIPAGAQAITGVDQSSVAIGDFIVEEGYTGQIGSATLPLTVDPDKFEWAGTGATSYISLHTANIAADVRKAATANAGSAGLYLTGSNLTTLTISEGSVGVAWLHGQSATVATVRVNGSAATAYLGKNASVTTVYAFKGTVYQHCGSTTTNVYSGGKLWTEEAAAITTLNMDGSGKAVLNSTGTIATLNMLESFTGEVDMLQSAEARTITTLSHKNGSIRIDKTFVTITNAITVASKPQVWQILSAA
jgi:hypothetical protein